MKIGIEVIAKICHETNREFCVSQKDYSQKQWGEAEDWQRDSVIKGVIFNINNPGCAPSQTHENWLAEKISNGWVFGKEKNTIFKTHPCIVPFNKLPIEQQVKDELFISVVAILAPLLSD